MPSRPPRSRRNQRPGPPKVVVNSYYSNRETGTSSAAPSPFKRQPIKKTFKKAAARTLDIILILVLAGAFIYSMMVKPDAKVIVNDTTYHPVLNYAYFINGRLSSFANRNKATFDQAALITDLKKTFPEIDKASVELPFLGQRPIVRIAVGEPAFFLDSGGREYLISSNGVAVDYKNTYLKLPQMITVKDESGFEAGKGKQVLSTNNVRFIETLAAEIGRKQIPIKDMVLSRSPQEVDLYTNDYGYYTKFYMGGDAVIQAGQYLAARNSFNAVTAPQQYLDVRIAGKVFYK